jgi:hypothetical protein
MESSAKDTTVFLKADLFLAGKVFTSIGLALEKSG